MGMMMAAGAAAMGTGTITVHYFPADDTEFTRAAATLVTEQLRGERELDRRLLSEIERRLRETYPRATVRRRTSFAALAPAPDELWYVFRDGRVA